MSKRKFGIGMTVCLTYGSIAWSDAPLTTVHPDWTLETVRPDTFQPQVGGLAFMPDGRLVVVCYPDPWRDNTTVHKGDVYILAGVLGHDRTQIKVNHFATGLVGPLGCAVVNDEIYVRDRESLKKVVDQNHDGVGEIIRLGSSYTDPNQLNPKFGHPFDYGLLFKDGFLYSIFGDYSAPMNIRGLLQNDLTGALTISNTVGFRNPNGLGLGPEGEIFAIDNQGEWMPANKLIHVKKGRFYGFPGFQGENKLRNDISPAAVLLPEGEIANSPTEPIYVEKGIFAGQMLFGDIAYNGGLTRTFLEKINGEYQGCAFQFTGGLECSINRLVWGPDGALYMGGMGIIPNWGWKDRTFGLQRLVPKTGPTTVFEMLAVRAVRGGFDIEFTLPVDPKGAEVPDNYAVRQWGYEPTSEYGGPKLGLKTLAVQSAKMDAEHKRVYLQIAGLETGKVVYIQLKGLQSASGKAPWTTETWYTLNARTCTPG